MIIVLEGIDGCGKSTQARMLAESLRLRGGEVLTPREPGATPLGERLRSLVLDPATEACARAEALIYLAARAELCERVLRPAQARGAHAVLDRFWHSTVAYQGHGLGLDPVGLRQAIAFATGGLRADRALWIDVPLDECLRRRDGAGKDRIEARGRAYLARVHAGYAALCADGDLIRIDGQGDPDAVAARVRAAVDAGG